jgi:hypothetical protein
MMNVRIACRRQEAKDIAGFDLAAIDGSSLPRFTAGAHIDVEIRPGLVRQYSLCNDPQERHRYQIAVLRHPQSRGGSAAVHEDFAEDSSYASAGLKTTFHYIRQATICYSREASASRPSSAWPSNWRMKEPALRCTTAPARPNVQPSWSACAHRSSLSAFGCTSTPSDGSIWMLC